MKTQQRITFATFMTMAAMRCTCVLPMPSKNALMAMVAAIEMTREHAPARVRDGHVLHLGDVDHRAHQPAAG